MKFDEIRDKIELIDGSKLKVLDKNRAAKLGEEFVVPKSYLGFLTNVGYGRIGNSYFQFYDGVAFVDEIFGYDSPETQTVLLFGDDYQGTCVGFEQESESILRVFPDQTVVNIATTFDEFISDLVKDLSEKP